MVTIGNLGLTQHRGAGNLLVCSSHLGRQRVHEAAEIYRRLEWACLHYSQRSISRGNHAHGIRRRSIDFEIRRPQALAQNWQRVSNELTFRIQRSQPKRGLGKRLENDLGWSENGRRGESSPFSEEKGSRRRPTLLATLIEFHHAGGAEPIVIRFDEKLPQFQSS